MGQNGGVPGLQQCTPNLGICIHAIKKADTGKQFPLRSPGDSQHRTEGRGDVNLSKIGQRKSQEGLARWLCTGVGHRLEAHSALYSVLA